MMDEEWQSINKTMNKRSLYIVLSLMVLYISGLIISNNDPVHNRRSDGTTMGRSDISRGRPMGRYSNYTIRVINRKSKEEDGERMTKLMKHSDNDDGEKETEKEANHVVVPSPQQQQQQEQQVSCWEANVQATQQLIKNRQGLPYHHPHGLPLPTPILNLGMPKIGTNTLHSFFQCGGYNSSHGQQGPCFRRAHEQNLPVLETCNKGHHQVMTQMDKNFPPNNCHYPQMSELEQIHKEEPNATFILIFRPMKDWLKSLVNFNHMQRRLQRCNLPNFPSGMGNNVTEFGTWFCGHVQKVRNFVLQHPSHALVELNLYDSVTTSHVMEQLFHVNKNSSCWGHANANPIFLKEKEEEE